MMKRFNLPVTVLLALFLTVAATILRLHRNAPTVTAAGEADLPWDGSVRAEDGGIAMTPEAAGLLEPTGTVALPEPERSDFDSFEVRRRLEGDREHITITALDSAARLVAALYLYAESLELRRYSLTPAATGWQLYLEGRR